MFKLLPALTLLALPFICFSQVVNGYAKITTISGTTLALSNVNESGDSFEDGEAIIIMQMQDDVIGGNTLDNMAFGDLSSIKSAGLFEVRYIASHTESGGVPTSIVLDVAPGNTYNFGGNMSVQIISFPTFGSPDYTTTMDMNALPWNGNIGGVLAFNVEGSLTLNHNLSVNGQGFRGGSHSSNYISSGSGCFPTIDFRRTVNHTRSGQKGEGIYKTSTMDHEYARGKLLNGGGGGGERINGGGAGGGNYSAGGDGGYGWSCTTPPGGGGVGGLDLSSHISSSRIFMGGGGGGGQQNNSAATDGGNGGGIIIVDADTVLTDGTCGGGSISISAKGSSVPSGLNDGQGGGGAGGTILFDVVSWDISATCPLVVNADGGDGGDVATSTHAGGGGGGQGTVIFTGAIPVSNTTISAANGDGGCSNSGCTLSAESGAGPDNLGILTESVGPLPIALINFEAEFAGVNIVETKWETLSEVNNDYFEISRSKYGKDWEVIGVVDGAGNSTEHLKYTLPDRFPYDGISYYRLKQFDFDGSYSFSDIVSVNSQPGANRVSFYPNPVEENLTITGKQAKLKPIKIIDIAGREIHNYNAIETSERMTILDLSNLSPGTYFLIAGEVANHFIKK